MSNSIFHRTVKPFVVEEIVDYFVFRRAAAYLVPFFAKIGMSPNQVTTFGLFVGLFSAWLFLQGHFFWGAVVLLSTVILDCVDGMLARYTGKMSPFGRLLDGFFDAIWVAAVWFAMFFSGTFDVYGRAQILTLMIVSGASMFLHCMTFDGIKNSYLQYLDPPLHETTITWQGYVEKMKRAFKSGNIGQGLVYAVSIAHTYCFAPKIVKRAMPQSEMQRSEIRRALDFPMRLWTFCGEGTHLFILILFSLLSPFTMLMPLVGYWVILVVLNIVWVWGAVLWFQRKRRIRNIL